MDQNFEKVKDYLLELNYAIIKEEKEEGVFVIDNEDEGIKNAVIIIAEPILIVEQFLFEMKPNSGDISTQLLKKNRDIIHGAFTLDEKGEKVIFRNTHECENLDMNELEATLNSIAILLSEYSDELIAFSKENQ